VRGARGLRGAAHQDRGAALAHRGVQRHGGGVEIRGRRRLVLEPAEAVLAAHQRRADSPDLLVNRGRQIADGEAETAVGGAVLARAVEDLDVVQRHLAGLQHQVDRAVLVDLDRDLLAARQHVAFTEGVLVRHHLAQVRARHDPHAAALGRRGREGDPGGHHVALLVEAPIGDVLVPADEVLGLGLLVEEDRFPAQDVGTDQRLHGIEDRRVADQLLRPGIDQVRLVLEGPWQATPGRGLGGLELRAR
jgi:hypothetical protein